MDYRKILAVSVSGMLFCLGILGASEISVTELTVEGNMATVTINDVVQIKEVEILEKDVKFPSYTSGSGKVFEQVRFTDDASRKEVAEAILNNQPSKKAIRKISYKVSKMSPYDKQGSSLKAFASVTFNGAMEVDCKVMKSKRGDDFWVAWPARPPDKSKGETKWVDQVSVTNKKVKMIIEKDIIETMNNTSTGGVIMTQEEVEVKEGYVKDPLTVTDVSVEKAEGEGGLAAIAQVDLNYSIRISNIKVYRRRDQTFLEFPIYKSDTGKEYDQIKIFSRDLRANIKDAVETAKPSQEKSNIIGFEITKFEEFWKKDSSLKYFCAVAINGAIEIECKVLDTGNGKPFVGWPSIQEGDEYKDAVIPCNKYVQDAIERSLLNRYHKEKK
ncbi:MAG: septation protein SpoVG family protein [Elusimicrobia bacterium]|nr:septation protein SpoVG family protein [Elusimicrobiota bacterium]